MDSVNELNRNFPDLNALDKNIAAIEGVDLSKLAHEIKVYCIKKALSVGNLNISEAARMLKMNRTTLCQFLKTHEIDKSFLT